MRRGLTMLELLIASVIFGIVASAATTAYRFSVMHSIDYSRAQQVMERRVQFENQVRGLIESAYLSPSAASSSTCFIASSASGTTNGGSSSLTTENLPDTIVFSSIKRVPANYLATTETSLDTLNDKYRPQGGVTEVGISTTTVGDPGNNEGLFIREQTPADSDHTQGGYESVLNPDVVQIGFEMFNGTEWVSTWDTTQGGQHRLPAAVRVSYSIRGDENTTHVFVVSVPLSDVTPDNPVTTTSGATG